jgi:hypothetical protein
MHPAATSIVESFLAAVDAAEPGAYSAVLYGSAARGDYVPDRSDVNMLLVFERLDPALLRRLAPAFERWPRKTAAAPLLVTAAEWARASDVFPLEITDMRTAYEVLRGADPLAGLAVRPSELRHALESELRGKLLRLRQAYVATRGDAGALGELGIASVPTVLVLLRGMLSLAGRPVPEVSADVVTAGAALAGFDAEPMLVPLAHRRDRSWRWKADDFERYLSAVERAAAYVDTLQTGDLG